jgi:hypothetical protein
MYQCSVVCDEISQGRGIDEFYKLRWRSDSKNGTFTSTERKLKTVGRPAHRRQLDYAPDFFSGLALTGHLKH